MNNRTGISVIIPAYNAGKTIARAVGSVLVQDFESFEIIIVNDGSTDGTAEICDELASHEMNVRVITKENGGVSSARNAGLDAARGEYVMFLDADDALRMNALDAMYKPDLDLIVGGFEKVSGSSVKESYRPSSGRIWQGDGQIDAFLDDVIRKKNCYLLNSSCFKLYRRSLIESAGLRFNTSLAYGEDKIFVFSYLCHVRKVMTVPSVVYSYMLQEQSLSTDISSDRHLGQIFLLIENYVPLLEQLELMYPRSVRLKGLYHSDVVGRYVFRILTQFAMRKTDLLDRDSISVLYAYIAKDSAAGIFSVRLRQTVNYMLYKIGKPAFSVWFYRLCSSLRRKK